MRSKFHVITLPNTSIAMAPEKWCQRETILSFSEGLLPWKLAVSLREDIILGGLC